MGRILLASSMLPAMHSLISLLPRRRERRSKSRIAYIPTADNREITRYARPLVRRILRARGFKVHQLEIARASQEEIRYILSTCDIIWVGGGNTFFLLHELNRSGAADMIVKEVAAGKTYVGVSAGAVVAGPDIDYIGRMDERGEAPSLKDMTGLHLVDFRVVPHFDSRTMGRAARAIADAEREEGHFVHTLRNAWTVIVRGKAPHMHIRHRAGH